MTSDRVKNPTNSNMYECALEQTWGLFGAYVDGAHAAVCCAVSFRPLGNAARTALESSMHALGYGQEACAFAAIAPHAQGAGGDADGDAATPQPSAAATPPPGAAPPQLDAQALFTLVEGLDPLCLIVADRQAAHVVADAYRTSVAFERPQHVFGRPCVAFESFEQLLEEPADKQRAWAALKQLPRFGERR